MKRTLGAAWWLAPPLLFLAVYWEGLWIWFVQDDFAWLGLNLRLQDGPSLWTLLFTPTEHGTLRPFSERGFFVLFYQLFGLNALGFRVWIYLTQIANLVLVAVIVRRLTGSRLAGFLAPIFWMANVAVVTSLSWISAYNEILCGFCLLLAFYLFLRHTDTGQWRYYVAQWIVFILGFGVLELNLVYPCLAASYALCCSRRHLVRTLPMFPVSALYAWVNLQIAPKAAEGPYAMHFDGALPATLGTYWLWAPGSLLLGDVTAGDFWGPLGVLAAWAVSLSLLVFLAWRLRQRRWLAGFFLLWFLFVIGPLLPLRDHLSDYYLTLPTIGLAMAGSWAVVSAWEAGGWRRILATALAALYLGTALPVSRFTMRWGLERSLGARHLVLSVGRAQQLHPGKIILLDGVSSDLFWSGVADKPFPLVGAREVYLVPGSEDRIQSAPGTMVAADYVLAPGPMLKGLAEQRLVVYSVGEGPLRNITSSFSALAPARWKPELARRVDVGQQLVADQLGEGWHPIEDGYRWMAKQALVRLPGPRSADEKLHVTGYSSAEQVAAGPVALSIAVNGVPLSTVEISDGDAKFDFSFALPATLVGTRLMEVRLSVNRTFNSPNDPRNLGLAFGVLAVR